MHSTRREFLSTTAATTGAFAMAHHAMGGQQDAPIEIGVIGVGWYGMVDAMAALKVGGVKITAICDADSNHLDQSEQQLAEKQGARPAKYKHYEEMLDHPGLDAVIIGSPPQWHALQFLAALNRGLDIYCEKPLAYDIRECQAMQRAAAQSDRVVQVGFQRRQSDAFAQVQQFIDQGKLGDLVQIEAQIHYRAGLKDNTPQSPPASLDWDLWTGPAPMLPYSPQIGHKSWRLEKTTGHGHLVDWGIHWIDACRMILREGMPRRVTAAGGLYEYVGEITTPDTLVAHFEFDRCPVVWRHRLWGSTEYTPETNNGIFFYGTDGTIFATDRKWTFLPRGKKEREEHDAPADLGTLHMADFLEAVRTRGDVKCSIDEGYQSTSTVKLAMVAYDSGVSVPWDADNETIPGQPPADTTALLREYRSPYVHPWKP